jgi:hypothetical protein
MNLDLDLSLFSRFFRGVLTELRQKRLWPVAALLVAALVAVPFLLSKSAPAPQPLAQVPTPPPASGTSIPALNVQTSPSHSHLTGSGHDPFSSGTGTSHPTTLSLTTAATTAVSTAANNAATALTGGAPSAGGVPGGSSVTGGSSSPSSPSNNPPSITPGATPKPAPSGLSSKQAYDVSLAITTGSGGVNTIDPLERLSVIPSDQQPLLVELGVSQDGNHVLFAVQPGAVPTGPGKCTPGPIDCEILSLGQDQTEELSSQTGSTGTSQVALFAITGITATDYSSAAAANTARHAESTAGEALLDKSNFPTLSLFQYEPSVGSVVDLRNLRVGG